MSESNLLGFLRLLRDEPGLLAALRTESKADVIAAAAARGLPFSNDEFDATIWGLEERLAETRGEPFSDKFTLWHLMWGRYYLEYLVQDLLQALEDSGLVPA